MADRERQIFKARKAFMNAEAALGDVKSGLYSLSKVECLKTKWIEKLQFDTIRISNNDTNESILKHSTKYNQYEIEGCEIQCCISLTQNFLLYIGCGQCNLIRTMIN